MLLYGVLYAIYVSGEGRSRYLPYVRWWVRTGVVGRCVMRCDGWVSTGWFGIAAFTVGGCGG